MYKVRNVQGQFSNGKTDYTIWKDKGGKVWGSKQAIVGHLAYLAELPSQMRRKFAGCVVVEYSTDGAAPVEHDLMTWVQIYVDRRASKKKDQNSRNIKLEVGYAMDAIEKAKAKLRRAKKKYEEHYGHKWEDRNE